jgi:hypothetical protein
VISTALVAEELSVGSILDLMPRKRAQVLLVLSIEELTGDALALLKVDLGRALRVVSGGRACPHALVLVLNLVSTYVI